MRIGGTAVIGAVCGAVGAIVWALAVAVYQPFMQPHGFFTDPETGAAVPDVASNNTYWPRDIRQLAILLAVAGVVLIARARPRALPVAAGSALAWMTVDLWLDRIDLAGRGTAAWLAVVGMAWCAATAALAVRLAGRQGHSDLVAHLTAGTAAVLAVVTAIVSAPWDEPVTQPDQVRVEDALTALKWVLALALALAAVGLVAHRMTTRRVGLLVAFGTLAAVAVWPAGTTYGPLGTLGLFGMPVAASLAVAATRTGSGWRLAAVAVWSVAALTVLVPLYFIASALGAAMTAFAHNPPVNGADTDLPLSVVGLALGVLLALISYRTTAPAPRPVRARPLDQLA